MDTMIRKEQSEVMVTITERKTNFIMAEKLPTGKDSKELAKAVITMLLHYKDKLKAITTDNGTEFAAHELITKRLGAPVYFTDPYSSWQKGAIENANKLIRQYIPRGASFKDYPPERIKQIQHKLNSRPREKIGFSSPKVEFYKQFQ
jgi:IS30 family transposase